MTPTKATFARMKVATNEWEKTRAISVVRGRRQEPPTRGRR